jgi:lysophospholipase L1-like esterase
LDIAEMTSQIRWVGRSRRACDTGLVSNLRLRASGVVASGPRAFALSLALHAAGCADDSGQTPALGGAGTASSVVSGGGATPAAVGGGIADADDGRSDDDGSNDGCDGVATSCAGATDLDPGVAGAAGDANGGGDGGTRDGSSDAAAGAASEGPGDAAMGGAPSEPDPGGTFSPCPGDGSPCVIMPFGDSITEGFPDFDGGYRVELFHQALIDGRAITFVGARANGPPTVDDQPFPTGHEGYSGFTIDPSTRSGISPRAEPAIQQFSPHIILLMIGTNDIDQNIDVANAPARLGALIDRITAAAPDTLLVVAQVIPTTVPATNERIRAFDAAIPAQVEERRAAGRHVVGVDMFAAFADDPNFRTELMVDALHPNTAGYALLGQRFYQVIETFLPAAP